MLVCLLLRYNPNTLQGGTLVSPGILMDSKLTTLFQLYKQTKKMFEVRFSGAFSALHPKADCTLTPK